MSLKSFESVQCEHVTCEKNCKLCGMYIFPKVQTFKSNRYISTHQQSCGRYLRSLRKKMAKETVLKEKCEMSASVFEILQRIAEKFEFGFETLALGIYLYNILLQRPDSTYKEQNTEFYSSVCLMVAAKAIELDKHIPYFSRYQKYACKNHTKQEYQKAEKDVMEQFEFSIQKPTFVSFVNFYLSNGVIFSDDDYIHTKVFVLEEKIKEMCYSTLKAGTFALEDQQKLAGSIVYECRKQFGLDWHPAIEEYSGLKKEDVQRKMASVLKPLNLQNIPRQSSQGRTEPSNKIIIRKPEKTDRDKSTSRNKERLHFIRTAQSLRSVPSFNALSIFGIIKHQKPEPH